MADRGKALEQVRIVDLTDEKSIYGAKLLADLGANVVRPEPADGDALRRRGPFDHVSGESLYYTFFGSSRRYFKVDSKASDEHDGLSMLCGHADILVLGADNELRTSIDVAEERERNPKLVVVECSSFGPSGPWKNYHAPDLVAGALGGSVGITGDADTPPLKTFGELNFTISGAYVAIAALASLRHARRRGEGQVVYVPVHECIASGLEHVFMWYFYHGFFPKARARALERRGTLHWTDLYVVMPAQNGSIMVTPTPSFDTQLAWLIEEDAFDDLLDPEYQLPANRRRYFDRFMEVLREWVGSKDVEELFYAAQDHHCPFGWVQRVDQVAANPQLEARDWWVDFKLGNRDIKSPGAAFSMSETPPRVVPGEWVETEPEDVLDVVGWTGRS